MARDITR